MSSAGEPEAPGGALSAERADAIAGLFGILAATVRVQILWQLASGDRDVGTLAEELAQTVPAVSHHLAKLRMAGLVRARRAGQRQVYQLTDRAVIDLIAHVAEDPEPASGTRVRGRRRSTA